MSNISAAKLKFKDKTFSEIVFKDSAEATIGYPCRAWVNFDATNGVGSNNYIGVYTPIIRGSKNVSSIVVTGAGGYIIKFTNAMPNNHYVAIANCNPNGFGGAHPMVGDGVESGYNVATTNTQNSTQMAVTLRIRTYAGYTGSNNNVNSDWIFAAAFC